MIEEQQDIIIANPMYDAVFKALMEDRDNAQYFVESIIDEEIVEMMYFVSGVTLPNTIRHTKTSSKKKK